MVRTVLLQRTRPAAHEFAAHLIFRGQETRTFLEIAFPKLLIMVELLLKHCFGSLVEHHTGLGIKPILGSDCSQCQRKLHWRFFYRV